MRFELEQRFAAPLVAVESAFVDPELIERMAGLPRLGGAELVERVDDGYTVLVRVRYAFRGSLPPAVTGVVDPARLSWVQESRLDRRTHHTKFRIVPDHYRDRLRCAGSVTLEEVGGETQRVTAGELNVRFPFVARRVERAIVAGLREHAAAEQAAAQGWLDGRR